MCSWGSEEGDAEIPDASCALSCGSQAGVHATMPAGGKSSSGLWLASHLPPAPRCYLPSETVTEPRGDATAEDKMGTWQQREEQGREVVPWKSQGF